MTSHEQLRLAESSRFISQQPTAWTDVDYLNSAKLSCSSEVTLRHMYHMSWSSVESEGMYKKTVYLEHTRECASFFYCHFFATEKYSSLWVPFAMVGYIYLFKTHFRVKPSLIKINYRYSKYKKNLLLFRESESLNIWGE